MIGRVPCCIPECRRSFKVSVAALEHEHDEFMCGRCYRTAEPGLVARHRLIHKRWRRAARLLRVKDIHSKPRFEKQMIRLDRRFREACARSWRAIRDDVMMKSAMMVEGTAGHLAAKRGETIP